LKGVETGQKQQWCVWLSNSQCSVLVGTCARTCSLLISHCHYATVAMNLINKERVRVQGAEGLRALAGGGV
jgi:hypothetical protein